MTREQLATRLGVDNAKLAYIEARGKLTDRQFQALIETANEYSMSNLAHFFETKLTLSHAANVRGNKIRGRRPFGE